MSLVETLDAGFVHRAKRRAGYDVTTVKPSLRVWCSFFWRRSIGRLVGEQRRRLAARQLGEAVKMPDASKESHKDVTYRLRRKCARENQ